MINEQHMQEMIAYYTAIGADAFEEVKEGG
jgi:hypothetical protein